MGEVQALAITSDDSAYDLNPIAEGKLAKVADVGLHRIEGATVARPPTGVHPQLLIEGVTGMSEEKHIPPFGHMPVIVEHFRTYFVLIQS